MFKDTTKRTGRRGGLFITMLCMAGVFAVAAAAQQPTAAQQSAIKSACRSDFMAQCSGVQPGGKAALTCLQQHNSSLSSACQSALAALGGAKSAPAASSTGTATAPAATAPATATAPAATAPATTAMPAPSFTPRQEMMIVRQSCGPDFRRLCSSVALGGGRAIACLRNNLANLSPTCQKVLTAGR
ncbi:cysteine rich repeat-containing protein [Phyllobacterium chamaecytisi]|uniref:cysteine rich repeat-containing protein n=1 Tax=Phyllobacterium chamaecytisi TaxID=2876082 RepID=UPI001CC908FA|nr:cysteine rich repeat-containing protein [Phyllobacterium sp. KW56]MBZ9600381.1 cysteine rich repeat-containing protein [Phyllobacterium sp. KW56]